MSSTAYKFSDNPPSQIATDIKNLNELNGAGQLDEFVRIALSFLAGSAAASAASSGTAVDSKSAAASAGAGATPQELLDAFATQYKVTNQKSLKNIIASLLYFFTECLKKNLSSTDVRDDLIALGLSGEKSASLSEQYRRSFVALSTSMIGKTLTANELVDLEWKFGVTASSSELKTVGTCFLQLKLVVDRGGGQKENVLMELTLPQFYQFQQQMQLAQKKLTA